MQKVTNRIAVAAAAGAILLAAPAQAQTAQNVVVQGSQDVRTAKVSFADLNLSSAAGRSSLEARVRGAVKQVCPSASPMPIFEFLQSQQCQQAAHAAANSRIAQIIAAKG